MTARGEGQFSCWFFEVGFFVVVVGLQNCLSKLSGAHPRRLQQKDGLSRQPRAGDLRFASEREGCLISLGRAVQEPAGQ